MLGFITSASGKKISFSYEWLTFKSTFLYFDWAVPGRDQKQKREVTNEGKK
jgi:hypothetical protein